MAKHKSKATPISFGMSERELQKIRPKRRPWANQRESKGRTRPETLENEPDNTIDPESLHRPGELEKALEGVKQRFLQADQRHRTAIDHEVIKCFRIARFLKNKIRRGGLILKGEWIRFRKKKDRNGNEALRFIFNETHADPKKASFYFRATRKLFEEGIEISTIPTRVTEGGGYQTLADGNVRFPRPKPAKPISKPESTEEFSNNQGASTGERERPKSTPKQLDLTTAEVSNQKKNEQAVAEDLSKSGPKRQSMS